MYFATNRPKATLPTEIAREFEELRAAQRIVSVHLFALVDCAFDERFLHTRYRRRLLQRSLYDRTALQPFGAAAPHLIASPDGDGEPFAWLSHLFSACGANPMLSLIATPLSIDELLIHMRPYLIAMTPDTVEWPVRWGDTRVLPKLLEAITESQRNQLLGPMSRWWAPARDGNLLGWKGGALPPTSADFDKLRLSDEMFAILVDAAEADSVLSKIYDSQPDLLSLNDAVACHERVARNLEVASANCIDAASAREHFSVLAISLRDDFTQHLAMVELLRRVRTGADYNLEIAALPAEFWSASERN